jgi:hydrogenase-1 operon protein HyaF
MSGLENISVNVIIGARDTPEWGNALPILHEIRHGLARLADSGESTLIDLRAIPFGPGDEQRLLDLLGRGEVEAGLRALGETRVWETAIPAVWLVDHYNGEGERIALQVEIDRIPQILCTQEEDVRNATARLDALLAAACDAQP